MPQLLERRLWMSILATNKKTKVLRISWMLPARLHNTEHQVTSLTGTACVKGSNPDLPGIQTHSSQSVEASTKGL